MSAGAPPQTTLVELTALHQAPLTAFKGPYFSWKGDIGRE